MGLFFEVLSAINNPNQNASVDQLSSITNSIQQLASSNGVDPSTMQTVLSGLGEAVRPMIRQQAAGGMGGLLGQLTGGGMSGIGAASFLTPQLQQQLIEGAAQRTGVDPGTLQNLIPGLLPIVMQLLQMGNSKGEGMASNPLLTAFLDTDRDRDVDLGDVFKFANRFLNPPR